jgi:hypothetical protein
MSASLPPLVQDSGVPFDVFIQALTEQLDKAQASMALKARVGKLPLTFAVKEVSLDLRAFVQLVDDDVYLRPAGPGDSEASTVKLALTTITKPMIEENAVDFAPEDPKFTIREALADKISEEEQRRLERIGVRTVTQLAELRKTAGADVVARLARMPVNRLQQALLAAAAPRVTRVEQPARDERGLAGLRPTQIAPRVLLQAPGLRAGRPPLVRAAGAEVPVLESGDGHLVLAPMASQLGCEAEIDFGAGDVARVELAEGGVGRWVGGQGEQAPAQGGGR